MASSTPPRWRMAVSFELYKVHSPSPLAAMPRAVSLVPLMAIFADL